MTINGRLELLKKNLQRMGTVNDDILIHLLGQAGRRLAIAGIKDDGSDDYVDAQIDYAAYLFRARGKDEADSGMPKFLRREINDLKIHQGMEVES